jgi:cell division protease FtsH
LRRLGFRHPRLWLIPLALILLNVAVARALTPSVAPPLTVPYSTFKEQLQVGNVVEITTQGDEIQGLFREPVAWPPGALDRAASTRFQTRAPTFPDTSLVPLVEARHVVVNARSLDEGRPWWIGLVVSIAPALLLSGLTIWAIRHLAPGRGMAKARARRYVPETTRVTFQDVAQGRPSSWPAWHG